MNEENNNLNNGTSKSGYTVKVVLITLLVVLLIGLIGFIVYDKVIKKDDVNNQPNTSENNNQSENNNENKESNSVPSLTLTDKEIYNVNNSISSDDKGTVMLPYIISDSEKALLQDLTFSSNNINNKIGWWNIISNKLENFNIEKMNRNDKMAIVAYLSNYSFNDSDNTTFISEDSMKKLYEKVFGTQDSYQNVNSIKFKDSPCGIPSDYSSKDKGYYGTTGCGGEVAGDTNFYTVISKVEKTNDEINVYLQAAHSFQYMDEGNVALFPYNYEGDEINFDENGDGTLDTTNAIWSGSKNKVDSTVVDLAKQNKLQTYKFTFKKQSDGKYYVYSGEWQ